MFDAAPSKPSAGDQFWQQLEAGLVVHLNPTQAIPEGLFETLARFTPKQRQATEAADAHRFTLFGGARGPGKSYWLRWYLLRRLFQYAERGLQGVRVMLACETYPDLYERQITKIQDEFPDWLGKYKASRSEFKLAPQYGGGVIALRNLDKPDKYKSAEFAVIGIDELTANPKRLFDKLRGSLRWPGIADTQFVAASNPDGRYAIWVRQLWVERDFPDELRSYEDEFVFVPGLPADNPHLDKTYWHDLNTLPPALRKAWVEGDWFAGVEGLVYPNFGVENLTDEEPDPALPFELAFDDGYIDPRAILFIQRSPTRVLVFDEIYESKRLEEDHVEEVVRRCVNRFGSKDDADATADMGRIDDLVEYCRRQDIPLPEIAVGSPEANQLKRRFREADIPARHKVHKVVEGIKAMRPLILDGNGRRVLQIHTRCRNLRKEFTELYRYPPEEKRREGDEKPLDGSDHACFVAGTLVETARGPIPIERIRVGDRVMTRAGYSRVVDAGMTAEHADVMVVHFSSGASLTGTPNHPVWIVGKGFVALHALQPGDEAVTLTGMEELLCRSDYTQQQSMRLFTKTSRLDDIPTQRICPIGRITDRIARISERASKRYTAKYGELTTVRSPKVITSITKMAIRSIIQSAISSAYRVTSTFPIMHKTLQMSGGIKCPNTLHRCVIKLLNGIGLKQVAHFTESLANVHGKAESRSRERANNVVSDLKRLLRARMCVFAPINANLLSGFPPAWTTKCVYANSAVKNTPSTNITKIGSAHVYVVAAPAGVRNPQAVYNLTVAAGEYFANGVLVHNCDALRYWVYFRARHDRFGGDEEAT